MDWYTGLQQDEKGTWRVVWNPSPWQIVKWFFTLPWSHRITLAQYDALVAEAERRNVNRLSASPEQQTSTD